MTYEIDWKDIDEIQINISNTTNLTSLRQRIIVQIKSEIIEETVKSSKTWNMLSIFRDFIMLCFIKVLIVSPQSI